MPGFPLEFTPAKAGAGMTEHLRDGLTLAYLEGNMSQRYFSNQRRIKMKFPKKCIIALSLFVSFASFAYMASPAFAADAKVVAKEGAVLSDDQVQQMNYLLDGVLTPLPKAN